MAAILAWLGSDHLTIGNENANITDDQVVLSGHLPLAAQISGPGGGRALRLGATVRLRRRSLRKRKRPTLAKAIIESHALI